jgi:hypothetical protein
MSKRRASWRRGKPPDPREQRNLLEAEIRRRRADGWELLDQTSDSAHFRRRRSPRKLAVGLAALSVLLIVASLIPGFEAADTILRVVAVILLFAAILYAIFGFREERQLVSLSDLERRARSRRRQD